MILNPSWTHKYEAYWNSIHKYNRWFIQLRFGAAVGLIALTLFTFLTDFFHLSAVQFTVVLLTGIFIIAYNVFFKILSSRSLKGDKFNEIEFSLFQIILDLMSLNIIIYFTGGIETPFILFYIFHMIIGSLILPVKLVRLIAASIMAFLFTFSMLEYKEIIYHQRIEGLLHFQIYNDFVFICAYLFLIGFVMFVAIALTNKIAQDLYQRELQLKQALEELREAEKTKQKYVMTVVHELKSPISASVSILDLVLGNFYGPLDEKIRERLERVRHRIEDSIEGINNILRLSRFKLLNVIDKEIFDISEVIEKIIDNQKPIADRKKIRIYPAIQKTEFYGDRTLLQLSFSNIINNSIKYTKEGGLIEVLLENKDGMLVFEVCDNGLGIPKSEIEKIFSEFYRASNVKGKEIEGTGTGLSIIKHIIEASGGEIKVESPSRLGDETRPGTSFILTFPLEMNS